MADPEKPDHSQDIIEELVHQFSDPFAFYRELIQNSIDAGSTRIEVTLRYQPGTPTGLLTAVVADWGEGMDRTVIERYLLTKFRSSKEGDLTKIGKFGIGFLSVFACAPDLVVVDTSRNGEDWRVIFHPDRTYELLTGPEPREGSTVTLHKAATPGEYLEFARRSGEAVRRWCRHSEADVAFAQGGDDGSVPPRPASVREPLLAEAAFQVEHKDPHTWIVAGPASGKPPLCGFYNRGLTLLESREELVKGVAFKVVSDLLEHTLTRDNVRRDRPFEKVMALVRRLAEGPLLERLPAELLAAAEAPAAAGRYLALLDFALERLGEEKLAFPLVGRGAVSGRTLREGSAAHGLVAWAEAPSAVTDALAAQGVPVLRTVPPRTSAMLAVAEKVARVPRTALADSVFLVALPDPDAHPAAPALLAALAPLLAACRGRFQGHFVGRLEGAAEGRAFAAVSAPGAPQRADHKASPFAADGPRVLCLERRHPKVASALEVARKSPALAAALLARLVAVSFAALDERADERLTAAALEARG